MLKRWLEFEGILGNPGEIPHIGCRILESKGLTAASDVDVMESKSITLSYSS